MVPGEFQVVPGDHSLIRSFATHLTRSLVHSPLSYVYLSTAHSCLAEISAVAEDELSARASAFDPKSQPQNTDSRTVWGYLRRPSSGAKLQRADDHDAALDATVTGYYQEYLRRVGIRDVSRG